MLRHGVPKLSDLKTVQARRQFPTKVVQGFQQMVQDRILAPGRAEAPLLLRLLDRWPWLQQFPAQLIGLGVRREHVNSR